MTAFQLAEWMKFAELEPFDETRADYRAASIAQAVINMQRDTKKHPKPLPIDDFVLRFGDSEPPPKPQQSWQGMKWMAAMITAAYGD